ncbi:MAG: hypothetical protein WBC91_06040 [Phototrophicaceae bacterium]
MIHVYWANEAKTIIQLDYSNPIASWDEYQAAIDTANNLAKRVNYSVTMLHNPDETPMPSGNPIEQLRIAINKTPKNVRIVMVINNGIAQRIVHAVIYIMSLGNHYKIVGSLDAAYAYIASLDCDVVS